MIKMKIAKDNSMLEELQFHLAKLGQGSLPLTASAMKAGADLISQTWKGFAMGGTLPGIAEKLKNPQGGYARSIRTKSTGDFSHEIYSEAQIAEWIENGTSELDMKTTHPFGPRSRQSKDGGSYLIIPFRWGTPGTVGFKNVMPINVYEVVSKFKKMRTTVSADNGKKTPNARGEMVGRAEYNKGYGRGDDFEGNMKGMVRSTDSTGKNRSGGYFTFRIISSKSKKGWVKPAMPARPVTKAVADYTEKHINTMVEAAIKGDLGV